MQRNGYKLRFHPSELSADCWYNPKCRNEDIQFLQSYLKPGDSFVDVGANIGIWVLTAATVVGKSGKVTAFEPHPRIFKFLRANVDLNDFPNVRLHNCAVGDRAGTVSFSNEKADDTNRVVSSDQGISVPVVTLNETLDRSPIALLKVDAEGYEKYILQGAENIVERVQCIFIEITDSNLVMFGCRSDEILAWLTARGYRLYKIAARSALEEVTAQTWANETSIENVVALRSEEDFSTRTGWSIKKSSQPAPAASPSGALR
jgi:FkbM family methyltransferase